ncbi:MAG: hypothetical protein J5822_09600 [Eubacteriaceae bacterium]|nr:hypothetical protein [Eubacteriaceae bacterium]
MKTKRRVGTLTSGAVMIVSGAALLWHSLSGTVSLQAVFRFWPLIIISLGAELLASDRDPDGRKYDIGAVILMFTVLLFALAMGAAQVYMERFGAAL